MRYWLLFDGRIWSEEILRTAGWTDEYLRPPRAYRVRERVVEPINNEQFETDLTKLDKPFGELDRATQLKLVEHVLDGGRVEVKFKNINQYHPSGVQHGIRFNPINTYRAIQS